VLAGVARLPTRPPAAAAGRFLDWLLDPGPDCPDAGMTRYLLAQELFDQAFSAGNIDLARLTFSLRRKILTRLLALRPDDQTCHGELLSLGNHWSQFSQRIGRLDTAWRIQRATWRRLRAAPTGVLPPHDLESLRLIVLNNLGEMARNLGRQEDAIRYLEKGRKLAHRLRTVFPLDHRIRHVSALILNNLGLCLMSHALPRARVLFRKSLRITQELEAFPNPGRMCRFLHALVCNNLCLVDSRLGLIPEAVRFGEDSLAVGKALLEEGDCDPPEAMQILYAFNNLGLACAEADDHERAARVLQEGLAYFRVVFQEYPFLHELGKIQGYLANNLGQVLEALERPDEAMRVLEEGLEALRPLDVADCPYEILEASGLIRTKLAALYGTAGRQDESGAMLERAGKTVQRLLARFPDVLVSHQLAVEIIALQASRNRDEENLPGEKAALLDGLEHFTHLERLGGGLFNQFFPGFVDFLQRLGEIAELEQRLEEALEWQKRCLAILEKEKGESAEADRAPRKAFTYLKCHFHLGRLLRRRGDLPQARDFLEKALELFGFFDPDQSEGKAFLYQEILETLATTQLELGDRDAAARLFRRALAEVGRLPADTSDRAGQGAHWILAAHGLSRAIPGSPEAGDLRQEMRDRLQDLPPDRTWSGLLSGLQAEEGTGMVGPVV